MMLFSQLFSTRARRGLDWTQETHGKYVRGILASNGLASQSRLKKQALNSYLVQISAMVRVLRLFRCDLEERVRPTRKYPKRKTPNLRTAS